jgi:hypothetical protein
MITFDLTYTFDPTSLGGYLEYRRVNFDGTFSPWVTATNSIGNINGYISPLTGTLTGVQGNIGNPPDFLSNTTYQFRMRQVCQDGTETYSPIDGDYFSFQCPEISIRSWVWNETGGGYYFPITIYPFSASTSVVGYEIMIYDDLTQPPLATYILDQVDAIANLPSPYIYIFDQNNVPGGLAFNTTYYFIVNVIVTTSTGSEISTNLCNPKSVSSPVCSMYRIDTGDEWYIEWTDCDGNELSCGNASPHPPVVPGIAQGTPFSICAIGKPKAYYCGGGGVLLPPVFSQFGGIVNGALATDIGPCDPSQYNYDTSTNPPTLDGQPCYPCI